MAGRSPRGTGTSPPYMCFAIPSATSHDPSELEERRLLRCASLDRVVNAYGTEEADVDGVLALLEVIVVDDD